MLVGYLLNKYDKLATPDLLWTPWGFYCNVTKASDSKSLREFLSLSACLDSCHFQWPGISTTACTITLCICYFFHLILLRSAEQRLQQPEKLHCHFLLAASQRRVYEAASNFMIWLRRYILGRTFWNWTEPLRLDLFFWIANLKNLKIYKRLWRIGRQRFMSHTKAAKVRFQTWVSNTSPAITAWCEALSFFSFIGESCLPCQGASRMIISVISAKHNTNVQNKWEAEAAAVLTVLPHPSIWSLDRHPVPQFPDRWTCIPFCFSFFEMPMRYWIYLCAQTTF